MAHVREPRSLYLMTAFGLRNPWVVWRLQRQGLDEWCPNCQGRGIVVTRPCGCAEVPPPPHACDRCDRLDGCEHCRRTCPACHGSRLKPDEPLMAEDFGDPESRRIAEALFPDLKIDDDPMHVRMYTRQSR